jgi:hypothetical protein
MRHFIAVHPALILLYFRWHILYGFDITMRAYRHLSQITSQRPQSHLAPLLVHVRLERSTGSPGMCVDEGLDQQGEFDVFPRFRSVDTDRTEPKQTRELSALRSVPLRDAPDRRPSRGLYAPAKAPLRALTLTRALDAPAAPGSVLTHDDLINASPDASTARSARASAEPALGQQPSPELGPTCIIRFASGFLRAGAWRIQPRRPLAAPCVTTRTRP